MEIFKDIPQYEGKYQISNKGRVWSIISQKYMKLYTTPTGYLTVSLVAKNGKQKVEKVHRLVGMAFIPNPDNLPQINHKDEVKTNNCVENLEWCDAKYNSNYGTHMDKIRKVTNQFDLNGNLLNTYISTVEASKATGVPSSNIVNCANGKLKTAGGFIWKYK